MRLETVTVLLFVIATAVALVARSLKVPYTVALVLAGLSIGATKAFPAVHLTRELLYAVFLPGLIFEAAFHLPFGELWRNKLTILALAFPGVLFGVALIPPFLALAGFGSSSLRLAALVFAALISATDPIAVVGLFKSLAAPSRLRVIIEGESLVNDGTAVVVYSLAVLFATHAGTTWLGATADFVKVFGLGLAVGGVVGFVTSKAIERIDDPLVEIALTMIAAYGSFSAAEGLHVSGIIATLSAGVVCGSYGAPRGMCHTTRVSVESFWEYIAFALNSVVFLLIGLEVTLSDLALAWRPIIVAFAVVTAARGAMVFPVLAMVRRTSERMPWRWGIVLTWGGLRGALSMVLALALPEDFAGRQVIVTTTFGVVILSIVVCGLTTGPLLRKLGIVAHAGLSAPMA